MCLHLSVSISISLESMLFTDFLMFSRLKGRKVHFSNLIFSISYLELWFNLICLSNLNFHEPKLMFLIWHHDCMIFDTQCWLSANNDWNKTLSQSIVCKIFHIFLRFDLFILLEWHKIFISLKRSTEPFRLLRLQDIILLISSVNTF